MGLTRRWALVAAVVGGWLVVVGTACALTPQVKDDAGFFSKEAVQKADSVIREIQQQHHKDLVIQTFRTVPAGKEAVAKGNDKQAKDRFFFEWARQQARAANVQGIYVLITRSPGRVEVVVGDATQRSREFSDADRRELQDVLASNFHDEKFDKGLLAGVQFVQKTLNANMRGAAPAAQPAPAGPRGGVGGQHHVNLGGLICFGVLILGVIWLVFGLIRGLAGMGARGGYGGYGPGGGYGGGGGGGFMSGLLGGMFGAVAGNWMYHNFFGGHSTGGGWGASSAYGNEAGPGGGTDQDYSGGGTDFDNSAGGGDFGGGGDYGGGDFGGGGGDFGGGGGGDFGGGGGDF